MIRAATDRKIAVMLTAFRDGLQSVFGGKVRTDDVLPAMQAAVDAGIRHLEFGGGARFQAPYFYVGENPFDSMDRMRDAVGPDVDLQILTRSVSGVTLTNQRSDTLALQARLMRRHGTTIDRNFDFMNDVRNLVATGRVIVEAGLHHQPCIAMMGLPYASDEVHTAAAYVDVARRLLDSGVQIDSLCMKDASGTTDPGTVYETARGLQALLGSKVPLWFHTHDTASTAVACIMAAIHGGADGVDVSVRPLASGTSQPDVRSVAHALKHTGYTLDVDLTKVDEIERALADGLADYDMNPITLAADARVVDFPMPGGAIGPNVHMMKTAGILDRYDEVLAEFAHVVQAAGAWTSVTPGSQQYWLQAFSNVMHGRWQRIDEGYGLSVLGYFGRPPATPDPDVVAAASRQLGREPFEGDPLDAAGDHVAAAREALDQRSLPSDDESVFLVAAATVPGKDMQLNEGIRLLEGRPRIQLPLRSQPAPSAPTAWTESVSTTVTVHDGAVQRTFQVTVGPPGAAPPARDAAPSIPAPAPVAATTQGSGSRVPVHSPFAGTVEVTKVHVREGDRVEAGAVVATVEAMKAEHDVRAPSAGTVARVEARPGDEVDAQRPILLLEA